MSLAKVLITNPIITTPQREVISIEVGNIPRRYTPIQNFRFEGATADNVSSFYLLLIIYLIDVC